jgi:hypothetical protein
LEKLSRIENNIKLNKLNAVYDILTEEQTILRKRNTILKIADHHGWDTGKEYLDSPSADDKEDLRAAISRANCKRSTPKPYNRPSFVGTGPRKMSLLDTVKTSSDGLDATGFTVKSRSVELAKATKKTPWIEFNTSRSPVDTTVLVIWSVIRFWRTPFTISPRNCST